MVPRIHAAVIAAGSKTAKAAARIAAPGRCARPRFRAACEGRAARRKAAVCLVIDLVHVLEYLLAAARCFPARDDPAAEDRVAVQAPVVLAGRAPAAAESITAQAGARGLTDDRRTGADACVRYLTNNTKYLRCNQALASGWPIATGVAEGAGRP